MVLGHESSGQVVEVGSAVTRVKVGDRVAIEPGVPSRYSDETNEERYNLCPHMAFAATPPIDGTLVKYYLSSEDFLVKLPEGVSYEEGACVEPLSVGVHFNKLAGVRFGSRVVVFGAGPVGLLTGAVARAFGASDVVFIDVFDNKLDRAKDFGATHTFNSSKLSADKAQEMADEVENFWADTMQILSLSVLEQMLALTLVSKSLKLEVQWFKLAWAKTTRAFQLPKSVVRK